ncbi:MAG: hypothetical protein [Enterobacter phage ENC7]|nr:MAG: hypothetical protein [Enterobacter phage ENC7]UIW11911.1 MAG: hypothetical protein [Enterobacter phage ENC25]UIW12169.1 MAG: hypothetical protein [Enterobacter phage ENC22]
MMMQQLAIAGVVVLFVLASWFFVKMYEHSEALEWFLDNERQFQKHFAGEFIFTHVSVAGGRVTFDIDAKGKSYHIELSLVDAKRVYDATQNGGMRKTLIPLAK